MGLKKNNPGCGCCETGCEVTCSDSSTQVVNQITFEILDLTTDVVFMFIAVTGAPGLYNYQMIEIDLTAFNGSYIITKDVNCEYPADPVVDITETGLSYSYKKWNFVSGSSCPSGTPDDSRTGTTTCRMRITLSNNRINFLTGLIVGQSYGGNFIPTSSVDPCAAFDLELDARQTSPLGDTVCSLGAIHNATATPSV